jgi:hypothetical protein
MPATNSGHFFYGYLVPYINSIDYYSYLKNIRLFPVFLFKFYKKAKIYLYTNLIYV